MAADAQIVRHPDVAAAMRAVDRADFTARRSAYEDAPQPIGYGVTISAPVR